MKLETIRDFEWHNEPEFYFDSGCMRIKATPHTDFWQNNKRNVHKDNGHFFFSRRQGNFVLTVKWIIKEDQPRWCQYGLMGRINDKNWCKASIIHEADGIFYLSISVTNFGFSDLVIFPLPKIPENITWRLEAVNDDLCLSYAVNDDKFIRVRVFPIPVQYDELKIGAYICSPKDDEFAAVLSDIEIY